MEEIKFNENGQGFIDFDYLLNITSSEFVNTIKFAIDTEENYSVVIENREQYVCVYIQKSRYGVINIFTYYPEPHIHIKVSRVHYAEMKILNEMFEGQTND